MDPVPEVVMLPAQTYLHRAHDCAIWALATFLSHDYEDVLIATSQVDKNGGREGLWWAQMVRVAALLGVRLRLKKRVDLEADFGIVGVTLKGEPLGHVAVLKGGQVIDSNPRVMLWNADVYFAPGRATPDGILVVKTPHQKARL